MRRDRHRPLAWGGEPSAPRGGASRLEARVSPGEAKLPPGEAECSPRDADGSPRELDIRLPGRTSRPWRRGFPIPRPDARLQRRALRTEGGARASGGGSLAAEGGRVASPGDRVICRSRRIRPRLENGPPCRTAAVELRCSLTIEGPFPAGLGRPCGRICGRPCPKGAGTGAAFFLNTADMGQVATLMCSRAGPRWT